MPTISAPASASASAMALPMPRRAPVTSAVFPSSLNRSSMPKVTSVQFTSIFMTSPPCSICRRPSFEPVERDHRGDQPVERQLSGGRERDGRSKSSRLVDARAGQASARARRSGRGPPWAARRRSPPPRCGRECAAASSSSRRPGAEPDTSNTTSAPAPAVRSFTRAARSTSLGSTASIPNSRASARRNGLTSASSTRAPRLARHQRDEDSDRAAADYHGVLAGPPRPCARRGRRRRSARPWRPAAAARPPEGGAACGRAPSTSPARRPGYRFR